MRVRRKRSLIRVRNVERGRGKCEIGVIRGGVQRESDKSRGTERGRDRRRQTRRQKRRQKSRQRRRERKQQSRRQGSRQ